MFMFKEKDTWHYQELLRGKKVPLVVLDTKWYQLFENEKMPHDIRNLEKELLNLLKLQGKLHTECKDLRKVKSDLMQEIMQNMDATEENADPRSEKKLKESRRLIQDINDKLEQNEEELYELPKQIHDRNKRLVIATVEICYQRLNRNQEEIEQIDSMITEMRIELKKNIIRKQEREEKNHSIYSYMHDILGHEIVDLFDTNFEG